MADHLRAGALFFESPAKLTQIHWNLQILEHHYSLNGGSAQARSLAPFKVDPVFENPTIDERIGTCVVLDRKSDGLLPFIFGVQGGLCDDSFECHEKARSRIGSISSSLEF